MSSDFAKLCGGISMNSRKQINPPASNENHRSRLWVKGVNRASFAMEDKALAVFQPDILINAQYLSTYRRRFYLQPEQVLMLAVLEDAVMCFQDNVTAVAPRKQMLFREAEEWILNDDQSYLFSFDNICEGLGLNPDYLRRGLKRWQEEILRELDRKQPRQRWAS
jgi:hypothetical protein